MHCCVAIQIAQLTILWLRTRCTIRRFEWSWRKAQREARVAWYTHASLAHQRRWRSFVQRIRCKCYEQNAPFMSSTTTRQHYRQLERTRYTFYHHFSSSSVFFFVIYFSFFFIHFFGSSDCLLRTFYSRLNVCNAILLSRALCFFSPFFFCRFFCYTVWCSSL